MKKNQYGEKGSKKERYKDRFHMKDRKISIELKAKADEIFKNIDLLNRRSLIELKEILWLRSVAKKI